MWTTAGHDYWCRNSVSCLHCGILLLQNLASIPLARTAGWRWRWSHIYSELTYHFTVVLKEEKFGEWYKCIWFRIWWYALLLDNRNDAGEDWLAVDTQVDGLDDVGRPLGCGIINSPSQPYYQTSTARFRCQTPPSRRSRIAPRLGVHQHAWIRRPALLVAGFRDIYRSVTSTGNKYCRLPESRNCDWPTNYWFAKRSLQQNRYGRSHHACLWIVLSCILDAGDIVWTNYLLFNHMRSNCGSVLDGKSLSQSPLTRFNAFTDNRTIVRRGCRPERSSVIIITSVDDHNHSDSM